MNILETLEKALLEGYATSEIDINTVFICIAFTTIISIYIFFIYKLVNKKSFYNRTFNLSLIALAIITAAVILTIQSNIVVSLGMVGALSIVRFRTAVKDPLDLVFLFWSISVGIICGAGYAMIAMIASVAITVIIILFALFQQDRGSLILVVDADSPDAEGRIIEVVKSNCRLYKVRARSATKNSLSLAIEVKTRKKNKILSEMLSESGITSASLVEHDGDITA